VLTSVDDLREACGEGRLWVATDANDAPVGFALASRVGANAHLDELDVHPDHGRRGLGRSLVGAVIAWARATRLPAVTLTTLRNVAWNAPFYESLGFRILARSERGPHLDELLRQEIARGLPAKDRVAMRLQL
jgi:GNAT superfamily N-acetyltransferase